MTDLRQQYHFMFPIQTRWADNDMYGHINNVIYYSFFDSAANAFLIQHCGFDPHLAAEIALVVSSACQFYSELSYPEVIEVGVAIAKIGNSSLHYRLAIFKEGQAQAAASGQFCHVFVNRQTRKSTPIPERMRATLSLFLFKALET